MTPKKFKKWSLSFTMTVLTLLTVFWFIFMAYAGILMIYAIDKTGQFIFLDTYISRICDCFMAGVITGLITRVVGNVFEFNDGSFMGKSNNKDEVNFFEDEDDFVSGMSEDEDVEDMEDCKDVTVTTTDETDNNETKQMKGWFK